MSTIPLDLSVLESMFGDDVELRNAILEEFANSATPYMTELDAAMSCSSAEGVKSLAHKLKSSSRTVGANALGDLCESLEESAPAQDWGRLDGQQKAVKEELSVVLKCIEGIV